MVAEQLKDLLAPLGGRDPCGKDPKDEPDFIALRQLIAQRQSLDHPAIDWEDLEARCTKILREQAKDLRVAAYLACAWLHLDRPGALQLGLSLQLELLSRYSTQLHPRAKQGRVVGRDRAFAWYSGELEAHFTRRKGSVPGSTDFEALNALLTGLASLDPQVLSQADDHSASLRHKIKGWRTQDKSQTRKSSPRPKAQSSTPAEPKPSNSASPGPGQDKTQAEEHYQALRRLACRLTQQAPQDPLGYRIMRQSLWYALEELRPDQALRLPGLCAKQRARLEEHRQKQRWPGLLELSEDLFVRYRHCLDLQRYSVQALEGLQATRSEFAQGYQACATAILAELKALLLRVPQLLDLRNAQGEPFADPETTQWVQRCVGQTKQNQEVGGRNPLPELASEPAWKKKLQQLQGAPRKAQLDAIQATLDQAPDRQSYARRCLAIAALFSGIAGLEPLLLSLAKDTLSPFLDPPRDRALEQACLASLMSYRQRADLQKAPAFRDPSTHDLALDLAKRELASALVYYHG